MLPSVGEIAYPSVVCFTIFANELIARVEVDGGDLISTGEGFIDGVESAGPYCVLVFGELSSICGVFIIRGLLSYWSRTE